MPNITGRLGNTQAEYSLWTGAFWNPGGSGKGISSGGSGNNQAAFDASRSSSAYKDGAPVQPRGTQGDLYFYLGSANLDEIIAINFDMLNSKANVEMNNLDDKGKNIANWSSNITNCLTEIPQDIKVEIGTGANAGKIIVKAGTKKTVPSGTGVFMQEAIPDDIIGETGSGTGDFFVFINRENVGLVTPPASLLWSGSAVPTTFTGGYAMWYNTDANDIKFTSDSGSTWKSGYSFPVAIVHRENGVYTYVVETLNGFGCIGNKLFALPGVKGRIPYYWNPNGTYKSISFETTEVLILADDLEVANKTNEGIRLSGSEITKGNLYYNRDLNINTPSSSEPETFRGFINVGMFSTDADKKITSFKISKTPFRAVDYNEFDEHRLVDFQQPTSANGYSWYRLYSDGWVEQGGELAGTYTDKTVTLPIVMANTNYHYTDGALENTDGGTATEIWIKSRTTTQMVVHIASNASGAFWRVCGMSAI